MPKPLSQKQLAELMRSMPGASEEEVLRAALQKEFEEDIPAPHIPVEGPKGPGPIPAPYDTSGAEFGRSLAMSALKQGAAKALEPLYQPTLRTTTYKPTQDAYSAAKAGPIAMPETAEALDIRDYPKAAASFVSSPADIAGLAAMGVGGAAGRAGLLGISRAARAVEAASAAPVAALGVGHLADPNASLGQKVVGAGMAALGAAGAGSAMTHPFPVGKVRDAYLKEAGRVNAGPHLRRADGSLPKAGDPDFVPAGQRPFADQKAGILPTFVPGTEADFKKALASNRAGASLTQDMPQEFYQGVDQPWYYGLTRMEQHPVTGKPEVDLGAVMNNAAKPGGALAAIMPDAIARGATTLDAWDVQDFLPGRYRKYGFQEYHRAPYDLSYGEPDEALKASWRTMGWKDGDPLPDVVYMKRGEPGASAVPARAGEAQPSLREATTGQSVESTIQAQADAPAGSLVGNDVHRIDPDAVDTSGIQLLGDDAAPVGVNASGESAASKEAQGRLAAMKEAGEEFVMVGPGGTVRPIAQTVDAVDVEAPKGWRKGIRGKDGRIRLLSVAMPAASLGIGEGGFSTGDEETDALIRMALMGSPTTVLLKAPQVKKLVTVLPELRLGRFMQRTADGLYRLTDEAIQNLRQWYERSGEIPGARGVWAKQNEMLAPAFDGQTGIQRQFNYLQAATSPRTELAQSTQEALAALAAGLRNPMAEVTPESMAEEGLRTIHNSGSKMPNVNRALRGEMLQSGNHIGKTQEYGDLVNMGLGGTPEELQRGLLANPPDLHGMGMIDESLEGDFSVFRPEMREFFAFHEGTPAPGQRGAINPQGLYDRFREARTAGWQEAVPGVPVSEAFADAWGARRHALGIEDGTMTPADMLIQRGLGEPGALLDPDLIRYALMRQDWPTTGSAGLASARSRKRGHR